MRSSFFSVAVGALIAALPHAASAQPEEVPGVVLDAEYPAPPEAELPAPPVEAEALPEVEALPEAEAAPPAEPEAATLETLSESISPYGRWIEVPGLGRVWQPHERVVGPGFQPYVSGGRWIQADAGWVFESDWPFGSVVFHYGRWHLAGDLGWVWVPGTEWAPSWCDDQVAVYLSPAPHRRYWHAPRHRFAYHSPRPGAWHRSYRRPGPGRTFHHPRRHAPPARWTHRPPRYYTHRSPRVHEPRVHSPGPRYRTPPRVHRAPPAHAPRVHRAPTHTARSHRRRR